MSRVYWIDKAETARDSAIEHIAGTNLEAALIQFEEIQLQTNRLLKFPNLGRPGRKQKTRDLSINRTSFVVTYRIIGDSVQILNFRHTSQRY